MCTNLHECQYMTCARACTHVHVPGAPATSASSEQGAVALETYPATRLLHLLRSDSSPIEIHTQGTLRLLMRLKVCFTVHTKACAPSSQRAGTLCCDTSPACNDCNGAQQGRCSSHKCRGGLRGDAAYLDLGLRAQDFGPQCFCSLFAHDEPVIPKQCSSASWQHA